MEDTMSEPQQGHISWSPDFKSSPPSIAPPVPPAVVKEFSELADEVFRAHSKIMEALTRDQFIKTLNQAIACGDFLRHVRVDTASQAVTYLPYRREQELLARITELEQRPNLGRTALTELVRDIMAERLVLVKALLEDALGYVRSDYNPGTPAYKLVERWEQMKKEWELR